MGGGGIFCLDVGIDFDNIDIYGNSAADNGGGIFIKTTEFENPIAELDNLLVYENQSGGHGSGICIMNDGDSDMCINKCTVVENTETSDDWGGVFVEFNCIDVVNCIVFGNDGGGDEPQYYQPDGSTTEYSCIEDWVTTNHNIISDPEFIDPDNDDYHLDWDSPCMDAGDPSFDLDDDGTVCDMGALVAGDHDNVPFALSQIGTEYYNWVGFPRLDFDGDDNEGDFVEATAMLECFTYPDPADPPDIDVWFEDDTNIEFYGVWQQVPQYYLWSEYPCDDLINSIRGFKFKVWKSGCVTKLRVFGDVIEEDFTMTIYDNDESGDESWFCYFLDDVQNGYDAFDTTTLDNLKSVKTATWTAVKEHDEWNWPSPCVIKYGELVAVLQADLDDDYEFQWQQPARCDVEPYERPVPIQFSYNEKIDYLPVFMDFNGNAPLEIAVYVDNVCRGAEVVDNDSLFQLRAYVLEEDPGYELEFVAYYGRSEMQVMDYRMTKEHNIQLTDKLITGNLGDYAFIEFGEPLNEQVPELEIEMKTYPNPFNPSMTISFQVAEFGNIDLDIYNAKGQKVKTLLSNHYCELGDRIEKVWNGYNDQGQLVSGGVYFVCMQSASDVQMKKAVLLK
ncbi:MAG: hypothetical protein K9N06_14300 [Candidatus Cloacimonetes bacterium]|nr:hypothetical protein [Candidatus Cloacimonadota bacterium]